MVVEEIYGRHDYKRPAWHKRLNFCEKAMNDQGTRRSLFLPPGDSGCGGSLILILSG
jgi:hypothetical protein